MLSRLALMFVLHVMGVGIYVGRRFDLSKLHRLKSVYYYLLLFYLFWGVIFAIFPDLIVPDLKIKE